MGYVVVWCYQLGVSGSQYRDLHAAACTSLIWEGLASGIGCTSTQYRTLYEVRRLGAMAMGGTWDFLCAPYFPIVMLDFLVVKSAPKAATAPENRSEREGSRAHSSANIKNTENAEYTENATIFFSFDHFLSRCLFLRSLCLNKLSVLFSSTK